MSKELTPYTTATLIFETIPPIMHYLRQEVRRQVKPQLTLAQFRVLAHVYNGVRTVMTLAELQAVSQPTMSKIVSGLVERGELKKVANPCDRRENFIDLTRKGRNHFLKIRGLAAQQIESDLKNLSSAEIHQLQKSLTAVARLLERSHQRRESE